MQPIALGVQNPQINALGAFREGAVTKAGLDAAKLGQAEKTFQMIGSGAMYALGGKIDGEVDPAKYVEVMDAFQNMGVDVSKFRDNPNFAKVAAQASVSALDRLRLAQSEREFELLLKKFEQDLVAGPRRSLNPTYGTDAQGNPVLLQVGDDGTAVQTQIPEGVNISTGVEKVDLGTQWGLLDRRSGQTVGTLPKDVAGEARAKEVGKAAGVTEAEYESIASKMPGLEKVVAELDTLSEQATYTPAGQMLDIGMRATGMEPRESAVARARYIAMVDNQVLPLLRDTFGAAFTQKEGETLRQTLGDPDKSPKEKQEVLKAFIEQKRRDVEALRSRVGNDRSAPALEAGEPIYARNPKTGERMMLQDGQWVPAQ